MPNKYILFLTFIILFGCSKDDSVDLSNAINIFESKKTISFVNKKERENSRLENLSNQKEILNSKSYNLNNSKINFPIKQLHFNKQWEIDTDQSVDDKNPYLPDPLFVASKIYLLNNNGYLFKINSIDGKILWKKQIFKDLENTIIGTPALSAAKNVFGVKEDNITLYAHNGSNILLAINEDNGKIIWEKKRDLPFRGGITSFKNFIFASDFDGNFLAIDNRNGDTLWNVFLGSEYNSVYTTARPIIAKNKIIVPATSGTFFIISIDTGEVLFSENISSNYQLPKLFHTGDIVANPLYKNGKVYIVSQAGFTAAFDLETSETLWNIPIGGFETPVVSGKTIFIVGNMGQLAAIDTISGKLRWEKNFPSYLNKNSFFTKEEIAIYKGPTLVDSKILISNQKGMIIIIDADNGTEIDTLNFDELAIPPIPINGSLLFLTTKGMLSAYE